MAESGLDSVLVFGDSAEYGNLVYLSNFIPFTRAALVVSKEKDDPPVIVTDAILHGEPINSYSWMTFIKDFRPVHHDPSEFSHALNQALAEQHAKRVGIVGEDTLPISIWEKLKSENNMQWNDFWFEFTKMKSVRSDLEISLQKEVGKITSAAMKAAVEFISPGRTESEVAAEAYKVMFALGAHDRSFQTIVNGGPRGGLKHSYPTSRRIEKGDLIYLDMGAMKFGYQCDMSRSVVPGGANFDQGQVLDLILKAFTELTSMMCPGVSTGEIISRAKKLEDEQSALKAKYSGRMFLGLVVHHAIATSFFEFPSLGLPDVILEKNMSFAFEPMAHILDFGTAVIEDTILITERGAESLTPYEIVHW